MTEAVRELATTRALDALPSGAWRELYEVRCPVRGLENMDHVVVGRAGVFVIDSRDGSGQLEVSPEGVTQDELTRQATINRVAGAAKARAERMPDLDPRLVVPVLCFDRDEPMAAWVGDVLVCTTANVVELLMSQRRVWEAERVDECFTKVTW